MKQSRCSTPFDGEWNIVVENEMLSQRTAVDGVDKDFNHIEKSNIPKFI